MDKVLNIKPKFFVLSIAAIVAAALILVAVSGSREVSAASTCLPRNPLAPVHSSSSTSGSLSGLKATASTNIGVIGHRAPEAGDPAWDGDDRVNSLAQIGNTVYAAGEFDSYIWKGTTYPRKNIVAFDANTGQPTSFAPTVNGEILVVTPGCDGTSVYIGGVFTTVNGTARTNAARVATSNGSLTSWNPKVNGAVEDISILRDHLVLAGRFTTVQGAARTGLASVDFTSAAVTTWLNPNIQKTPTNWGGGRKVTKIRVNPQGTTAVAIGNFDTINGASHPRIAVFKLTDTSTSLAPWRTAWTERNGTDTQIGCNFDFGAPELDVTWVPSGGRFVTVSTGGGHTGNTICDSAARWDGTDTGITNTNAKPTAINYTGGDTLSAVACTDATCAVSGHNRWANNTPVYPYKTVNPCNDTVKPFNLNPGRAGLDCQNPGVSLTRPGIYELSGPTMRASGWNPTRSLQRGMHNAMMFTPQGLWLGSDGDNFAGQARNDLVLIPFN